MVVLLVGLAAVGQIVVGTAKRNRANLLQAQGQMVAERELERLTAQGCSTTPACGNIIALDNTTYSVFSSAAGEITNAAVANANQRQFMVAVDVDAPGMFEGAEAGAPVIGRVLAGAGVGTVFNVRVTVSWDEPSRPRQVVAMQTRMAP